MRPTRAASPQAVEDDVEGAALERRHQRRPVVLHELHLRIAELARGALARSTSKPLLRPAWLGSSYT